MPGLWPRRWLNVTDMAGVIRILGTAIYLPSGHILPGAPQINGIPFLGLEASALGSHPNLNWKWEP